MDLKMIRIPDERELQKLSTDELGNAVEYVNVLEPTINEEYAQSEKMRELFDRENRKILTIGKNEKIFKSISCTRCFEKYVKGNGLKHDFDFYFKKFQNKLHLTKVNKVPEYNKARNLINQFVYHIVLEHDTPYDFCGKKWIMSFGIEDNERNHQLVNFLDGVSEIREDKESKFILPENEQ